MKHARSAFVILSLLLIPLACAAGEKPDDMTAAEFQAQKALFVKQLDDGKTYSEITPENRKTVEDLLDRMDKRVQSAGSVDKMSKDQQVAFFNDQEQVNTLLTKAREDSRLICSRDTPTGTHMPVTNCKTVAERRKDREDSQRTLQNLQVTPGFGGN